MILAAGVHQFTASTTFSELVQLEVGAVVAPAPGAVVTFAQGLTVR